MRVHTTIVRVGKTVTGIRVPDEIVEGETRQRRIVKSVAALREGRPR